MMTMINFVKQRIQSIIELKKQRHFLPGVLLGSYAIVILATVMSLWSFMILGKIELIAVLYLIKRGFFGE